MKTYSSISPSSDEPDSPKSYLRMFVLGLIVIAPSAFNGIMIVYPAIALPQMKLDISNASWFGSMAPITAPIGSIVIGYIIDKLGRRSALLFSVLPTLLGWMLLASNYSLSVVLIGQALNGIANGATTYPSQVYASECIMVNNMRWRDNYLSWMGMGTAFGMCFALLLAYFIDYQKIAVVSATMAFVVFLLIYAFIPESPSWLYHKGRIGDAEWSQSKLGISQPILKQALESSSDEAREAVESKPSESTSTTVTSWAALKSYPQKIKRKEVYKPLLIMMGLFVLLTFCGAINVLVYLVNVIQENDDVLANATVATTNVSLSAADVYDFRLSESYKYSAIAGILILVANCMVCATVSYVGVKKILSGAALVMALGFIILGHTTTQTQNVASLFTLHIVAVWVIIFAFNFGVMNLPNSILGDLFPADAKGYASVVCVFEFIMTGFLVKVHPYMRIAFGGYLYYGYAFVSILGSIYVAIFMVETVGKTTEEIKREFNK